MTKQEMLQLMNGNPVFHLATVEGDQPRVRGMLLYRAGEDGIIFHTASTKDLSAQIKENPRAELCFQSGGVQLRVAGTLQQVVDEALQAEIYSHPSRGFLREWQRLGVETNLEIYIMKHGIATEWTMERNFDEKSYTQL